MGRETNPLKSRAIVPEASANIQSIGGFAAAVLRFATTFADCIGENDGAHLIHSA
jgi:hypothetical protein